LGQASRVTVPAVPVIQFSCILTAFAIFHISATINLRVFRFNSQSLQDIAQTRTKYENKGNGKMKTNSSRIIIGTAVICITSIAFSGALANTAATTATSPAITTNTGTNADKTKNAARQEIKALIEANHSQIKAYMEQKKSEREAFKESIKGKTTDEQKTLIEEFRSQQASDIKAFITQHRSDLTSKIQSSSIPDDKKSAILAKLQERWSKVDAKMAQHVQKEQGKSHQKGDKNLNKNTNSDKLSGTT
jgi:hypothetical protein